LNMLKLDFKLTACSLALAVLAISLFSVLLPPSEDFQQSNPYWNGLQTLFKVANATALDVTVEKVAPENSVLFLIGPSLNVTRARVEALKAYVSGGGTLVLMDEAGAINAVLSSLELGVSVDGRFMLDALFYHRSWKMPKVVEVKGGELTSGVESIVLNLPSILSVNAPSSNLRVLAYSSRFSFLDLNGDGKPSPEEPMGPFILAVEGAYGRGRVIVFSDSSPFLNSVIGLGDNLQLLKNIVKGKAAFVDVGAWQVSPQLAYRNAVLGLYKVLSTPEIRYSLALVTLTAIYALTRREKYALKADEVYEVLKRHPGWDRRLLIALREAREKVGG